MKLFLLAFLVVALFNIMEATHSDNGKNDGQEKDTNKSQLDMLLARLKQQDDQIQQLQKEGAHQRLQTKEQKLKNEELQVQLQDQQLLLQDQQLQLQQEIKERRHDKEKQLEEIKELTKVNRARRSENETEHLLELIRAEINHVAGLSQCEVGTSLASETQGGPRWAFSGGVVKTISFEQNFTRTPKVVTSIFGFYRDPDGTYHSNWGGYATPESITTTKFDLRFFGYAIFHLKASWIACI